MSFRQLCCAAPSAHGIECVQVLKLVRKGSKARGILEFVEFMGTDAQKFALRCIRLMIAEVEIAKLKLKHDFALDAKV